MSAEDLIQKLEKMLLLRSNAAALVWEPPFGPRRLLVAALWLKLKNCLLQRGHVKRSMQSVPNETEAAEQDPVWEKSMPVGMEKCKADELSPHPKQKKHKNVALDYSMT